jgi:AcrR family transcriptional regulator
MTEVRPRRRSETARRAILDATLALIRDKGVAALTVEGIAARAGVGKQTIYRWWPSKGMVAVDALLESARPGIELGHGPDIWADLTTLLGNVAEMMADPDRGPHWAAILAQTQTDPAVAQAFHQHVFGPIRDQYRGRLTHLRDASALAADPDDFLDLAFGALWFRLLTRPAQVNRAFGERIARQLRTGLDATTPANRDEQSRPGP